MLVIANQDQKMYGIGVEKSVDPSSKNKVLCFPIGVIWGVGDLSNIV